MGRFLWTMDEKSRKVAGCVSLHFLSYYGIIFYKQGKEVAFMHKVLIADGSESWRLSLERTLGEAYQVECCADGAQALELLSRFQPEVLVMDLMLARVDGLSVLQTMSAMENRPRVIMTGKYFSNYVNAAMERFQVDFAVLKPCSAVGIAERVGELVVQTVPLLRRVDPYDCVTAVLLSLNAPTSQRGFRYLRDGILLMMEDPGQQLTKSLYPAIAKRNGTTIANVEKCIRTTVHSAWKRRREEAWRQYFPLAPNGQIPRPTSGQFLTRMADAMTISLRRQA